MEAAPDVVRVYARESQACRDLLGRRRAEAQKIVAQCQRALDGLRQRARSSRSDTDGTASVPAGACGNPSEEPCLPVSACAAASEASLLPASTQEATCLGGPSLAELQELTTELLREREELRRRMLVLECKPSDKPGIASVVQEPDNKIHADRSALRRVEGCHGIGRMLQTARNSAPESGWQRVGSGSGAKFGSNMDLAHHRRVRICKAQLKEVTFKNGEGWTQPGGRTSQNCFPTPSAAEQKAPDAVSHDAVYPAIHKALSARAKRLDRDPNLCPGSAPAQKPEQSAPTHAWSSTVVESEDGGASVQHESCKLVEDDDADGLADLRGCDVGENCRAQGNGATVVLEEEEEEGDAAADALSSTMPASGGATICQADAGRSDTASACGAQPVKQAALTTTMAVQIWQQHHKAAACSLQTATRRHLGAFVAHVHRTSLATRIFQCCVHIMHEGLR